MCHTLHGAHHILAQGMSAFGAFLTSDDRRTLRPLTRCGAATWKCKIGAPRRRGEPLVVGYHDQNLISSKAIRLPMQTSRRAFRFSVHATRERLVGERIGT